MPPCGSGISLDHRLPPLAIFIALSSIAVRQRNKITAANHGQIVVTRRSLANGATGTKQDVMKDVAEILPNEDVTSSDRPLRHDSDGTLCSIWSAEGSLCIVVCTAEFATDSDAALCATFDRHHLLRRFMPSQW